MMRTISLGLMAAAYAAGGIHELIATDVYLRLMPPSLVSPLFLIYLSAVVKFVLVVGLLVPGTRRLAAWGFIALLVAMFPANVYIAAWSAAREGLPVSLMWLRVPLQFVFMLWAYWHTRPERTPRVTTAWQSAP
ncbi:MAG TPA: hypothetical protein VK550_28385 [Polyangiaceae bacterium]|jgi:uncharacterized membrane protein|nr:hypothetical protein [Polyangiaceae bacterium]